MDFRAECFIRLSSVLRIVLPCSWNYNTIFKFWLHCSTWFKNEDPNSCEWIDVGLYFSFIILRCMKKIVAETLVDEMQKENIRLKEEIIKIRKELISKHLIYTCRFWEDYDGITYQNWRVESYTRNAASMPTRILSRIIS